MDLNQAVFTVKAIVEKERSILHIVHDEDSEWQFLSDEFVTIDDLMIVSLKQIIEIDETINDILSLAQGYEAHRNHKGGKWAITRSV
jgi:hypothetical protein